MNWKSPRASPGLITLWWSRFKLFLVRTFRRPPRLKRRLQEVQERRPYRHFPARLLDRLMRPDRRFWA